MAAVHRHDEVERLEVAPRHLPRALRAQVVAAPARVVLRAPVGRMPDVPVAGARRLDVHFDARLLRQVPQHALGGRRAADVAGADEQHSDRTRARANQARPFCRRTSTMKRWPFTLRTSLPTACIAATTSSGDVHNVSAQRATSASSSLLIFSSSPCRDAPRSSVMNDGRNRRTLRSPRFKSKATQRYFAS